MRFFRCLQDRERLKELLESINLDFFPPISKQEGSIDSYADKLLNEGSFLFMQENGKYVGILGYFISNHIMNIDLVWVPEEKRKSSPIFYRLSKYLIQHESAFNGKVRVKTWKGNLDMVPILEKIGFELTKEIAEDYIPERTSLVYEVEFSHLKRYFGVA